jgi:two-component system LytT family response regulator
LDEVEWIESEGNYVRLHRGKDTHLLRETMAAIEAKLDPDRFMRIHRQAIVNVERIRDLRPWFTGEYIVRMQSGRELTLTRSYRDNLRLLLGKS